MNAFEQAMVDQRATRGKESCLHARLTRFWFKKIRLGNRVVVMLSVTSEGLDQTAIGRIGEIAVIITVVDITTESGGCSHTAEKPVPIYHHRVATLAQGCDRSTIARRTAPDDQTGGLELDVIAFHCQKIF